MARTSWILGLALLLGALTAATSPAQEGERGRGQSLAVEGNRAYEAGDYRAAAEDYRAALRAGLDDAAIHYNLGNALFKQGELGEAVVAYERALRRDPRDGAARANLARARGLVRDEALAPLRLPVFLRPVGWLYHRLSLGEWLRAALLLWILLCLAGAARAWWRPGPLRGRGLLYGLGGLLAICLAMAAFHAEMEIRRRPAVVVVGEADVRSGPGESYKLSFRVHEGLKVYVDEERGEWARIHLGGELVGWLPAAEIEEI